ncbi:hypothetical protein OG339_14220 [Streptosporangium sp. NBC_01495]|uniref:hypothetical protein n=1 Tax=Streptosporangium sp. NBC_01495 TaxID=2903899 RepID=UPI002E2FA5B0|nr:hypothetical protein [Streptosporangium sp. NBC_01495]
MNDEYSDDPIGDVFRSRVSPARHRMDPTREELATPVEYLKVPISKLTEEELLDLRVVCETGRGIYLYRKHVASVFQSMVFEIDNALELRGIKYDAIANDRSVMPPDWVTAVAALPLEGGVSYSAAEMDVSKLLDRGNGAPL